MGFTLEIWKEKRCTLLVIMSNFLNHHNSSVPSHNLERPSQNCSGGIFFCEKVLGCEKRRHDDFNKLYIHRTKNQNANRKVFVLSSIFYFKIYFVKFSLCVSLRIMIVLILYFKIFVRSVTAKNKAQASKLKASKKGLDNWKIFGFCIVWNFRLLILFFLLVMEFSAGWQFSFNQL